MAKDTHICRVCGAYIRGPARVHWSEIREVMLFPLLAILCTPLTMLAAWIGRRLTKEAPTK